MVLAKAPSKSTRKIEELESEITRLKAQIGDLKKQVVVIGMWANDFKEERNRLKVLVRKMGGGLNQFYKSLDITEGLRCPYCRYRPALSGKKFHKEGCLVPWTEQILSRPEVRAIMEGELFSPDGTMYRAYINPCDINKEGE